MYSKYYVMNILLENYLLKDCKKRGIELGLWYVIYKNAAIEYYDIQYEAGRTKDNNFSK